MKKIRSIYTENDGLLGHLWAITNARKYKIVQECKITVLELEIRMRRLRDSRTKEARQCLSSRCPHRGHNKSRDYCSDTTWAVLQLYCPVTRHWQEAFGRKQCGRVSRDFLVVVVVVV